MKATDMRHGIAGQLLLLAVGALAVATLIAFAAEQWWVAELFTHFRIQYVAAGALLLALAAAFRYRTATVILAVTLAVNVGTAGFFLPLPQSAGAETLPGSASVRAGADVSAAEAGRPVRILSANVNARNTSPAALLELVEATVPDLLLILEHTPAFDNALGALHGDYPHRLSAPSRNAFGIALYSRRPLSDGAIFALGGTDAVHADLDPEQKGLRFLGVHLLPPMRAGWASARNEQLDRIAALVAGHPAGIVVCGDFNLTPYSPYFRRLTDTTGLRPARLRRVPVRTWPVGFFPLGLPIDHCLAGPDIHIVDAKVLGDIGSDHYPLLIEVRMGTRG